MALNSTSLIYGHDIYVLTEKGDKELRGSGTSLSPAEIELLVCLDGGATVTDVAAKARLWAPGAVMEAFRELANRHLIRLRTRKDEPEEIAGFFTTTVAQATRCAGT